MSGDVLAETERIIDRVLQGFPEIVPERKDGHLTVPARDETGFPVLVSGEGRDVVIGLELWHEHFDDPARAAACFLSCLTTACRLHLSFAGETLYRATLETNIDGEWGVAGTTGLLLWPFWRKRRTEVLRNRWIETEDLAGWLAGTFPDGEEPDDG